MEVYHKTSCVTCKKVLSELERMKKDVETRDFIKEPFSETELKKIIKLIGKKPSELIRKRDKMYKKLGLEKKKITDEKMIKLMIKYPGLIQRPIIITNNKDHVGKINVKEMKL